MKKAVIYGAGNIGRGFIGELFFKSGYQIVFIDVNEEIVVKMNLHMSYPIRIVSADETRDIFINNIRAVNGRDSEKVQDEIADADIMATAVGVNILSKIAAPIARGLKKRWENNNLKPLNIIICENLIDANTYLKELIREEFDNSDREYMDELVGFVRASIGRMVPVMTSDKQEENILRVCVEEYCELPVDRDSFKGEIPKIWNMLPVSPFESYIQRKLFIHNMGHAITAYLGYLKGYRYIWEAISDEDIRQISRTAMMESAQALSKEHNIELSKLQDYIDDLICRFGNRRLEDTIERVGRDITRKLLPNDRLIGAFQLCVKNGIKPRCICTGIAAAICFKDSEKKLSAINDPGLEEALENVHCLMLN